MVGGTRGARPTTTGVISERESTFGCGGASSHDRVCTNIGKKGERIG